MWRAYLAQARASRWSGRPGRRFDSLAALSNAATMHPALELRNEAIACLALPDMQVRNRLRLTKPTVPFGLTFDPEYERCAVAEPDGSITICQLPDNTELFRLQAEGKPNTAALLFSPKGQFLGERYYGAPTNECRVWDLSRRALVLQRALDVRSACFDPGDHQFVAAEHGGTVHFYSLPTGEEKFQLNLPSDLNHLCFAPDGKRLAVSRHTAPGVIIVDLATKHVCRSFTNSSAAGFMSWSPDGRLLACPHDQNIELWDPETGQRQAVLAGHAGACTAAAFDHAGDLLVSSGWDGMTRLWDPRLHRLLVSLPGGWVQPAFARNDRMLAVASDETGVEFCDVAPSRECVELGHAGFTPGWEGGGQFSPDGQILATASDDGVRVWDVAARRLVCFLPMSGSRAVVFLPDGGGLLACGRSSVQRWRILPQPPKGEFRFGGAERIGEVIAPTVLNSDGRSLLAAETNREHVVRLDLARLSEPVRCASHFGVASLAASPDGKWLATGSWKGTGVRVFALPSGDLRRELPVKGSADCAFSPNGQWLATGSAAEYCLWRVGSWKQPVWTVAREGAGDMIGSMVFSPDGRMLALLHGRSARIKLVAATDGRELATLETGRALCFSPDDFRLATIADDGHSVLLWDLTLIRRQLAAMKLDWDLPPSP
jgi:WD40 repeat protein